MTVYEVLMQVKLDLADDTVEAAQRVIENKMNEGEIYEETAHVFSIRPIPREELPESAHPNKKKPGFCMVPQCRAEAYWYGPGAEDLITLREAFRRYVFRRVTGMTVKHREKGYIDNPDSNEIEKIIDDAVREVLETK